MGKVLGVMYAFIGIIIGGLITIFTVLGSVLTSSGNTGGAALFGIGAIIFFPIMYGILGLVFGALSGWLYNLSAKWTGGIEMEFDDKPTVPEVK